MYLYLGMASECYLWLINDKDGLPDENVLFLKSLSEGGGCRRRVNEKGCER